MPQLCFPKRYTSEYHLMTTFAPADEPDAVVPDPVGDTRFRVHWSCFRGHLDPDDIAKLQGSPGMRQRWVEAWESAGPLLEEINRIYMTKTHLAEPVDIATLATKVPYKLGRDWPTLFQSANTIGSTAIVYALDWRGVRRSWAADNFERLQPAVPAPWHPFCTGPRGAVKHPPHFP